MDASIDLVGVLGPKSRDFSVVSNSVPEPAAIGLVVSLSSRHCSRSANGVRARDATRSI